MPQPPLPRKRLLPCEFARTTTLLGMMKTQWGPLTHNSPQGLPHYLRAAFTAFGSPAPLGPMACRTWPYKRKASVHVHLTPRQRAGDLAQRPSITGREKPFTSVSGQIAIPGLTSGVG